jgi:cold shock CspA family protein
MGGFNDHGALILLAVQRGVEQAGVRDLIEGRKIAYEVVRDNRTGSPRAENLKPA